MLCRSFNHLFTAYTFIDVRKQTEWYSLCLHLNYYYVYLPLYTFYNHFRDNEAELVIYVVVIIQHNREIHIVVRKMMRNTRIALLSPLPNVLWD